MFEVFICNSVASWFDVMVCVNCYLLLFAYCGSLLLGVLFVLVVLMLFMLFVYLIAWFRCCLL